MNRRDGGVLFLRFVLIPIFFGAAGVLPAAADVIIYNVNRTVVLGSVTGTITTDGTVGTLATNDITSWNLTLNGPAASPFNLPGVTPNLATIWNHGTPVRPVPKDASSIESAHYRCNARGGA